jgi:predicted nucleotidyltransferase
MRRIRSSGSVKVISLNRDEVIRRLREVAAQALAAFPELREVRLIGSLAEGTYTGTSDVDLLLLLDRAPEHPLEQIKPYFYFFSERLNIGLDVFLSGPTPPEGIRESLRKSILLAGRV